MKRTFTLADMEHFLVCTYGNLGQEIFDLWVEYNDTYFDGILKPLPVVIVQVPPYGSRVGSFRSPENGTVGQIELTLPSIETDLVANPGTLLHEMVHQHIHQLGFYEAGCDPHMHWAWQAEVSRIEKMVSGRDVYCAPVTVGKVKLDDGSRKSVKKVDLRFWNELDEVWELKTYGTAWNPFQSEDDSWFENYRPSYPRGKRKNHQRVRGLRATIQGATVTETTTY